jgi:hypothetical protein
MVLGIEHAHENLRQNVTFILYNRIVKKYNVKLIGIEPLFVKRKYLDRLERKKLGLKKKKM